MTEQSKLYTCNKAGCNFKANHKASDGVEYLTEFEYKKLIGEDGKLKCKVNPSNISCGMKELEPHEYPKPKKKPLNIKLIASIAVAVIVVGGLVFFFMGKSSDEQVTTEATSIAPVEDTTSNVNTVDEPTAKEPAVAEAPVAETPAPAKVEQPAASKPEKAAPVSGGSAPKGTQTLSLGGNTYKGEVMNGKPHGMGTMYYKKATQISPKDLKKRMADSGDYLTGEFYEGNVVQGKLFDSDNNVKEVIMIGR